MTESATHHELRTPLNQIIGYAEMLQEEARDRGHTALLPDLEKIHAAARTLLGQVVECLIPERFGGDTPSTLKAAAASPASGPLGGAPGKDAPPLSQRSLSGRVLVVDDDALNLEMLARRLARFGCTVTTAANGREALEQVRATPFDLLLLDMQMPELNGYQVLEQLSADPRLRELPVVVLSASDDTLTVAHCIKMGAVDYLPKPFDPVVLQARIGACLDRKRLRDQEAQYLSQIEDEKQRSEELLQVILPHSVVAELKATAMVRPRRFEGVAVLFCDIAGFTAYCEAHPPEDVVTQLQNLVVRFEDLAAEHGLEKIKTIGDSFMAAAGLLAPLPNPALSAVKCGLAMAAAARALPPHWSVRVGVHIGPVIAGVVGRRKYQYDVWGDTVNTAARMEAAAAPGTVGVNGETWARLARHCRARPLGTVEVKGKPPQEVFCIESVVELPPRRPP